MPTRHSWRDRLDKKIKGHRRTTRPHKVAKGTVTEPLQSAPEIVASKPAPPPATKAPRATAKHPTARKQHNRETIVLGPCTLTLPNGQTYRTVGNTIITLTKEPHP